MESTWETRDLPVLITVVELDEEGNRSIKRADVSERTGFTDNEVNSAFYALSGEEPPFCKFSDVSSMTRRELDFAHDVSGHARRTVGAWPTPESLTDRIVAALNEAAEKADDPEEASRLKRAAEAVGGVGKGVLTGVLTHVLTGAM